MSGVNGVSITYEDKPYGLFHSGRYLYLRGSEQLDPLVRLIAGSQHPENSVSARLEANKSYLRRLERSRIHKDEKREIRESIARTNELLREVLDALKGQTPAELSVR